MRRMKNLENRSLESVPNGLENGINAADHIKLAYKVCHRYDQYYNDFDELLSEALYALVIASLRWNPEIHSSWSTYSFGYMQGYIERYIFGKGGQKAVKVYKESLDAPISYSNFEEDESTLYDILENKSNNRSYEEVEQLVVVMEAVEKHLKGVFKTAVIEYLKQPHGSQIRTAILHGCSKEYARIANDKAFAILRRKPEIIQIWETITKQ